MLNSKLDEDAEVKSHIRKAESLIVATKHFCNNEDKDMGENTAPRSPPQLILPSEDVNHGTCPQKQKEPT